MPSWLNGICFINDFVDVWTDILAAYEKNVTLPYYPLLTHTKSTGNDHERKPHIVEPVPRDTILSGHFV